jgi:RNA polymerase sigma-70 factor (ECF subfamily)
VTIFDNSKDLFMLSNATTGESTTSNYMTSLELNKQINKLSDEYKKPFEMHHEGYKYKEIADQLDIPIGTVKSRIFIARKKLMDLLPDYSYFSN